MVIFKDDDKQQDRLNKLHDEEAEDLAELLSKKYAVPYIDLSRTTISTDALRLIPEADARQKKVVAFNIVGRKIDIATISPSSNEVKNVIDDLENKNFQVSLFIVSENSLEKAWSRYKEVGQMTRTKTGTIDIAGEDIDEMLATLKSVKDIADKIKSEDEAIAKGSPITNLLEVILAGGLSTGASDIHFEPEDNGIRLRYRLDGVLEDIVDLKEKVYHSISNRIKLVAGMKLNIKLASQDGRFSIDVADSDGDKMEIEIRASVLPSAYGEAIVLRILNPKTIALTLDQLGISPDLLPVFEKEISKPNGMVLLTGPTGSGKTTTLYAFLRQINSPDVKVITIEDPIEYHLDGINQTQVNNDKGYTFASGLRSAVRQDPDIIMVGEIRDNDTAEIAVNSSLTGHLVFSTIHTNNAFGAIPRLIDLGINPKILGSSLTLSIGQRLVRRLCDSCKETYQPPIEEKTLLENILASIKSKKPDFVVPAITELYRPVGCDKCNQTGYKGRIGIYEAMKMDEAISDLAIQNPNEKDLKKASLPQGILDMRQDGILKVIAGVTSVTEVGRMIDLYEEII